MAYNKKTALLDNIQAIEIAFRVDQEKRKATATELQVLKKYSGFGGLKCVLYDARDDSDQQRMPDTEKDMFYLVNQLNTVIAQNSNSPIQCKEYIDSIRSSVQTAFYTPSFIPQAIASVLKSTGMTVNSLLDPSAGIGVFGQVMQKTWPGITVDCYEKDLLTAKITAALNPGFKVKDTGFEKIPSSKAGKFDLVTSNIPFGNFKIFDPSYRKSGNPAKAQSLQLIHQYFFLKGIDALRPGGVLAFITSKGLMDSPSNSQVRESVVNQCNLLSAVRFPDNLFSESSGINVPSDLILLQKRLPTETTVLSTEEEWFVKSHREFEQVNISAFFHNKYENILADIIQIGTNQFGKPDYIYHTNENLNFLEKKLIETISADVKRTFSIGSYQITSQAPTKSPIHAQSPKSKPTPDFGALSLFDLWDTQELSEQAQKEEYAPYTLTVSSLSWHENGMLGIDKDRVGIITDIGESPLFTPIEVSDMQKFLLADYLTVRDSYAQLYYTERDTQIEQPRLRDVFNRVYDKFREQHGPLNEKKNQRVIMKDPFQMAVQSVELFAKGEYVKGTLFFESMNLANTEEIPHDLTPTEALLDSYNRFGTVNLMHISNVCGLPLDNILNTLKGRICYEPYDAEWQPYEKFISCNVYAKYDGLKAYLDKTTDKEVQAWIHDSMQMLEEARPKPKNFADIDLNMGERWIPMNYYSQFACKLFVTDININYFSGIDRFTVEINDAYTMQIKDEWAITGENKSYNGLDLFRYALEDRYPDVTRTIKDKKTGDSKHIPDAEKTQLMAAKVSDIREQFVEWMQKIPLEEKQSLMNLYNRIFNCYARPKFDGSHQTFPGLHLENIENVSSLYASQKDAVWMGIMNFGGNIDHSVGGGKTLTMCILAHELVRLNKAKKPVITGLKSNINAIAETYSKAYPQDRMLFVRSEDMSVKKRLELFHRIKNNSWDVIIMSHENIGKIKQSDRIQTQMISTTIDELCATYNLAKDVLSKRDKKNLEKTIENKKVELMNLLHDINTHKAKGTAIPDFEEMGIGHILVDESHQFKNMGFGYTKHSRVSGLGDSKGSQKAKNLLLSIRTIQERTNQDLGASFFSGTTISNSLTELYSNFVYLRPRALANQGVTCFDAWLANFAQKTSEFEINVTNEIVNKERFRYFIKVDMLAMFYAQITDFRIADDIGLKRPKMVEELRLCKLTPEQENFAETLKRFAQTANFDEILPYVKSTNEKAKMLIATDLERKMALDMRILNPINFSDHPENKISRCAADISSDYYKYNDQKGTQFCFTDLGAYKGDGTFTPVEALKQKLIEQYGLPSHEIRFIQEFDTDKKKAEFTRLMNAGEIRVAIGGTSNMGTGINAQERCVAINHLDIPWRPSDLEQRNGRGCRPGNLVALHHCDNKLNIRYYCTEKSLDAYKYNLLKLKQGFIYQFKSCSMDTQKMDEGSLDEKTGMNYSEYCAILSGNTDLLEKIKLDKLISRLEGTRKAFYNELDYSKYNYQNKQNELESDKKIVVRIMQDERALTPQIKERLQVLKSFDTSTSYFRETTQVRVGDYAGVSSSEKVGELIQMKIKALSLKGNIYRKEEIGTFGEFKVCIESYASFDSNSPNFSISVHGPGNIYYKHNNGNIPLDKILTALSPERALLTIPRIMAEYRGKITSTEKLLNELSVTIQRTWGKESQLAELKAQRVDIEKRITNSILENNSQANEEIGEAQELNEEEFADYQERMEVKSRLSLMGLYEKDIYSIMEGTKVILHDLKLTNPFVETDKITCSSVSFMLDNNILYINEMPVKEFFENQMREALTISIGYKR